MQQDKDNQKNSKTNNEFLGGANLQEMLKPILGKLKLDYINKLFGKCKRHGVLPGQIFQLLLLMPYLAKENIHQYFQTSNLQYADFKKDAIYNFLKNPKIDWRKTIYLIVKQVIKIKLNFNQAGNIAEYQGPTFLIVDDTALEKSGKKIENIGKVYNHSNNTHHLGFKVLTTTFFDGQTCLPLDFSVHSEPCKNKKRGLTDAELKKQFKKERDSNSPGFERDLENKKTKPEMALALLENALKKKIIPNYILADTWFISEGFISGVKNLQKDLKIKQLDVIGMIKSNRNIEVDEKTFLLQHLPEVKRKSIKKSKKHKCQYILQKADYKGIEVVFYAVKMNGQEKWRYLVSTDLSLSFDEVMAHYKVRWTIEVFFKEVKQNLNLNGCQSTDFDALIAHISLVFINYAILSTQRYFSEDATLGGVFKGISTWSVKLTFFAEILSMLSEAGIGFSVDAQEAILVIILKINEMHFPKKQSKQNVKPPSEPLLSKAS